MTNEKRVVSVRCQYCFGRGSAIKYSKLPNEENRETCSEFHVCEHCAGRGFVEYVLPAEIENLYQLVKQYRDLRLASSAHSLEEIDALENDIMIVLWEDSKRRNIFYCLKTFALQLEMILGSLRQNTERLSLLKSIRHLSYCNHFNPGIMFIAAAFKILLSTLIFNYHLGTASRLHRKGMVSRGIDG